MIFPIMNGILSFTKAPVTWALFFINLAVFMLTMQTSTDLQSKVESYTRDGLFSRTQGVIFADFIAENPSRYPANIQYLAYQVQNSFDPERRELLGNMALRDSFFLKEATRIEAGSDQVALTWWKKRFSELTEYRELHPSYGFGVTRSEQGFFRMLTYQFSHSGFSHFAGNMIFFLIFACSLEGIIGGLGLLMCYLLSGIFAALSFSLMNEASAIPLIGASGAISGIMALFCVLMWGRGVRYVFFLLVPKRGYAGLIYLPAWITLILWFLSDLAGHLATPSELGGIAYSAHLGGELCGIMMGLIILSVRKLRGEPLLPEQLPIDTKPVFTRYI